MKAHTKTAEKIKAYVDRLDFKAQELNRDIDKFLEKSKVTYQQEMESLKQQTDHTKEEAREMYHQKVEDVKESYEKFASEGKSLVENRLKPVKTKIDILKQEMAKSTHQAGEKLDHMKDEAEELLETTKLAFHNFRETFKQRK